ncbi:MAG: TIR domain-containing protein [Dehalococcoidia bacterium]
MHRFQGSDGRSRLVAALERQRLVGGNRELADALACQIRLRECQPLECLIAQGGEDNDLYFILSGCLSIQINGREIARRSHGEHIGEMALLDPGSRRSASVIAIETAIVAQVSEASFTALTQQYPVVWRNMAAVLGDRLRDRTRFVRARNETPVVFIGSSRESLPIAEAIQACIPVDVAIVRLWTKDVFGPSHFPIEDLEEQLDRADFAVLVLGPDDRVDSRGTTHDAPRDNVIFELGLFMGACTRRRVFLATPRGVDVKIPSDLLGLTPLSYSGDESVAIEARLADLGAQLVRAVSEMRSR